MSFSGASVTSSTDTAAVPANSVNDPVGWPAAERYPGAVDAGEYGPGSYAEPGGPAGPPATAPAPDQFGESAPGPISGGGYQDTAWSTGHDAASTPWDSSAGPPFAPSGALNPALHGEDTGGVWLKEHVIPAGIGQLTRHTMTGQTNDRLAPTQTTIANMAPNGRQDLDQQQWWNPDGHDPWEIPYSERAILNNVAYQPIATTDPGTSYGVAGQLPDRSPYDYQAQAYAAPPDPEVQQAPATAASQFAGSGWVM